MMASRLWPELRKAFASIVGPTCSGSAARRFSPLPRLPKYSESQNAQYAKPSRPERSHASVSAAGSSCLCPCFCHRCFGDHAPTNRSGNNNANRSRPQTGQEVGLRPVRHRPSHRRWQVPLEKRIRDQERGPTRAARSNLSHRTWHLHRTIEHDVRRIRPAHLAPPTQRPTGELDHRVP